MTNQGQEVRDREEKQHFTRRGELKNWHVRIGLEAYGGLENEARVTLETTCDQIKAKITRLGSQNV